jgi:hypothetical protein
MAITKIQAGALPAGVVTVDAIADTSITHAKLHTTMDLSGKTVTLPTISALDVTGAVTSNGLFVGNDNNYIYQSATGVLSLRVGGTGPYAILGKDDGSNVLGMGNASGSLAIYAAGSEAMRIDSAGNVGIGTSSPTSNLTIGSSQNDGLEFTYDATNAYRNKITNYWNSSADTRMDFDIGRTGGVAPVTVMSVGYNSNVGIGTSSPTAKLDVVGSPSITTFTGATELGIVVKGSTGATDYSGMDFKGNSQANPVARIGALTTSSGSYLSFGTSNSYASGITNTAMTIDYTGKVGIGTSSPYGKTHWQDNSPINLIATNTGADGQLNTTVMSLIGQARGYSNNLSKLASIDFKTDPTTWYKGNMTFNIANSDGTNPAATPIEAMKIDAAGRVTKPYQPSFHARLNAAWSHPSGTVLILGTWAVSTNENIGNCYNTSTRRFTAPVSGTYAFNCIVATQGGVGTFSYLSAELWVNGARRRVGYWGGGGSSYGGTSGSYTAYLSAGDYAELASESNKTFAMQWGTGSHTQFSGHLVG